ncbi:hypothetical protein IFM89_025252 [Coptis chinensis]|uniref:Pentatricopeptide repeat-containing protein n=1 Tax=Coptis chinensis TaxID=261450 RepID=A0A835I712_9MAGN|nr:hypothetical protein IFM89_025252 [Coptis chinensis]
MKLHLLSNGLKSLRNPKLSRVFNALFYTTETSSSRTRTPIGAKPKYQSNSRDNLYHRIAPLGDPNVSMVPVLEKWAEEGKSVNRDELISIIKELRVYRRYKHALEISQWMTEQNYIPLSAVDVAGRLDLIAKVHGLELAEKYFDSISLQIKKFPVYNTLLYCYASAKSIEKAEAFMQQMKQLGYARSPHSYNVLLSLYSKVGRYEKLESLVEEMKVNGVHADKFTMSIQMAAYAANSNIDGMEKILQSMEVNPKIIMDWNSYAIAANGYIKIGCIDKALQMLKNSEKLITGKQRRVAYDFLLTIKDSRGMGIRTHFLRFRVPNLLIAAYCKNGLVEKAEMLLNKTVEKGKKPLSSTWGYLATGYVAANEFPKALKAMESALLARRPKWMLNRDTLSACLEYLKQQGDAEKTEEFVRLLGAPGHVSTDNIERLLDYIYIHNAEAEVSMEKEVDDIKRSDNEETDEIANEAT